jgi:DNA-binding transcriptional LysR family regulator
MDLTLRQLAIFDAVARLGSVSQAAVELHLSQSAASMALQNLERALGKQLFLRAGKRLVLSYHGKQLQPMARSILLAAEELGQAVTEEDIPGGQLRVGASPTVGDYLLNDLCGMFMAKHPEVRLSVIVLPALDVINRVDEMAVDVGLIEFVSVRPTLDVIRWRKSVFSVFCSPHHPLAGEKRVSTRDLEDESWCLQHRHADSRRQFTLAALNRMDTMNVVLESDSLSIIKAAVRNGIGLGCLPRDCIASELEAGTLTELAVEGLELAIPFCIVLREGLRRSAAATAFIDSLLAAESRPEP